VISLRRKIGSLHFAVGQNALVKAEEAQKNFVQTLTKTFADLPIGLAVFDLSRRLVLFNPALLDLTKLPVEFLMADPRLDDFLGKLRETRLLPEPKNYLNWRERITGIETEAQAGTYGETWNLPSGKVFRVTGRPHPNGAVAFLFEDISADVSSTRRFRSQIEVGQAVLDANPNGIALFSNLGTLTFSNKKFSGFLGLDGESTLADVNITDVTQMWQDQSQPSPIWSRINEFSNQLGDRGAWFDTFQLKDGRTIKCEVTPLIEGNTLCTFSLETMKTSMGKTEIGVLAASG
jgi:PAS domain-containing protein